MLLSLHKDVSLKRGGSCKLAIRKCPSKGGFDFGAAPIELMTNDSRVVANSTIEGCRGAKAQEPVVVEVALSEVVLQPAPNQLDRDAGHLLGHVGPQMLQHHCLPKPDGLGYPHI